MSYKLIKIQFSSKPEKKMMAIFLNLDNNRTKTTHFGSFGMSDYTIHKDSKRKQRYLLRHKKNENWDIPVSAGSLSRYILWNKKSIDESIVDYKKRFNFK
jgi:hypothetical protein